MPAAEVAAAGGAVQHFFSAARIRDLILGALALILLVIVAGQSKLFEAFPRFGANSSGSAQANPAALTADGLAPGHPVQVEAASAAATAAPKKAALKTNHPTRQIVVPSSTIDLAVQHQFKDATLYVWVDDKLTLTLPLHGASQKKLVVFNGTRGVESKTLNVPAGKRVLRFRAVSTDQAVDLSKSLSAEFVGGDTKELQVSFDRHNSAMHLNWQ